MAPLYSDYRTNGMITWRPRDFTVVLGITRIKTNQKDISHLTALLLMPTGYDLVFYSYYLYSIGVPGTDVLLFRGHHDSIIET